MWQCPSKNWFGPVKGYLFKYWTKWPVGIWAPPLWSMWMSCKLDAGSSNLYSFTGPNVCSTSIYLGKHCMSPTCAFFVIFLCKKNTNDESMTHLDKLQVSVLYTKKWNRIYHLFIWHVYLAVIKCNKCRINK